jgi:hypothetical protein
MTRENIHQNMHYTKVLQKNDTSWSAADAFSPEVNTTSQARRALLSAAMCQLN